MNTLRTTAAIGVQTGSTQASRSPARSGLARLAKVNWTVLLWAIGVPLPLVAIIGLMRGCS